MSRLSSSVRSGWRLAQPAPRATRPRRRPPAPSGPTTSAKSDGATTQPATTPPATTTTAGAQTSNVVVTDEIRTELIAAGAALNSLSPSDYTGLVPGETYYAYDASTKTYWAGAGLVPNPASTQAQVSAQDDGAYLLFERQAGGTWKAFAVGLAGTAKAAPARSRCPLPSSACGAGHRRVAARPRSDEDQPGPDATDGPGRARYRSNASTLWVSSKSSWYTIFPHTMRPNRMARFS